MSTDPQNPYPPLCAFEFPLGLPGFESERRFLLLEKPEFAPLVILQSPARPELRFVCAPIGLLDTEYRLDLTGEEAGVIQWGLEYEAELGTSPTLLLFAILTFPESGPPTANLLAPVVLNPKSGRGVQSIQSSSDYSERHPLHREPPCS